jgi:transposase-like protein
MLTVVPEVVVGDSDGAASPSVSLLDEIVREGARRMLAAALEAEAAACIDAHAHELDEQGWRLVVRNGNAQPRQLVTGAGAVEVVAPRVNDKRVDEATGQRKRFFSAILPPWCRKSPKVSDVLPLLYLHGLSGNDFAPGLEQFLGTSVGLSAATVTRLTTHWQEEARAFQARDPSAPRQKFMRGSPRCPLGRTLRCNGGSKATTSSGAPHVLARQAGGGGLGRAIVDGVSLSSIGFI